jgi:hypothetical protein
MNLTQVRYAGAICVLLASLLAFEVHGWGKKRERKGVTLDCGNQTLAINPTDGTKPKAIYVCAGDVITWDPKNDSKEYKFKVHFRKKSPFVGGRKDFDNDTPTSPPVIGDIILTVYEYDVTVDGNLVDDPQVIGGGGH